MNRFHRMACRTVWQQPAAGIILTLLLATVGGADQRLPGSDQDATATRGVAPATFTRDAGLPPPAPEPPAGQITPAPRPSTAPLALSAPQPLAAKPATPARGPLPDWKLLLAVAAAFGILVAFRGLAAYRTNRTQPLPPDVFDVLGVASLGGGHAIRVVRFGPKTLLVSTSTAGCQTLAELTDPQATDRIAAACATNGRPLLRPSPRSGPAAPRRDTAGRASA
jgi:hypothetical protein